MRFPKSSGSVSGTRSCYGCGVCAAACPRQCIGLRRSRSGFWIPHVDGSSCVECGLCVRLCPTRMPFSYPADGKPILDGMAAWLKDADALDRSSSGGAVTALAAALGKEGYEFCGVRYVPERLRAEHFLADSPKAFEPAMGSKYLPSLTMPAFREMLTKDKKWMVVGTPCQIAALRRLIRLRGIENRFVLVDFRCHGVPSMRLWDAFLRSCRTLGDPHWLMASWRDKSRGWQVSYHLVLRREPDATCLFSGYATEGDSFYTHFLDFTVQNQCCYDCPFQGTHSEADVRVADFWGKRFAHNQSGVSQVLALSERGREVWGKAAAWCVTEPLSQDEQNAILRLGSQESHWNRGRGLFRAFALFMLTLPGGLCLTDALRKAIVRALQWVRTVKIS